MKQIPQEIRRELSNLDRMTRCARRDEGGCRGSLEWHHVITGLGRKQLQEPWAIQSLCYEHHRGELKNDEIARYYAYQNVTDKKLAKYKLGQQMIQEKLYLNKKFGVDKSH